MTNSRRNYRALLHRLIFHWRDDARRMTQIEAELSAALEHVARLEAEIVEQRENSQRIAELIDLVEHLLTPHSPDKM